MLEKLMAGYGIISASVMVYMAGARAVHAMTVAANVWALHINHALGACQ